MSDFGGEQRQQPQHRAGHICGWSNRAPQGSKIQQSEPGHRLQAPVGRCNPRSPRKPQKQHRIARCEHMRRRRSHTRQTPGGATSRRSRRGTAGRCRARRGNFRCGDATRCWAVYSSDKPTRPSDACRPWTVWRSMCAARWPRASGAVTRASRRLHGRWRRRPARFSAGWLRQAARISNCWILRERTPPSAICRNHRCRSVRSRTRLAILNPQPSTERSGDGITKRHRRFASADEMSPFVCPCQHGQRSDSAAVAAIRPTAACSTNEPVRESVPRRGMPTANRARLPSASQPAAGEPGSA